LSEPIEPNSSIPLGRKEIFDLFAAASDLPASERRAFLDVHCGSNRSVRIQLEGLLAFHDDDKDGMLDESIAQGLDLPQVMKLRRIPDGTVVGERFRVIRTIGSGGMGTVYEAEDLDGGSNVALKTIRVGETADGELAKRLRRELRLGRDVSHPNVCRVYDYWDVEDAGGGRITFFTMELLAGETLAQRLALNGKLAPSQAIQILRQVAAGIDEVHRVGIVHRDLKPSNIFLVSGGEGAPERAVVMDFGIARESNPASESNPTTTGMMIGTPRYMSPEQANGKKVDRSSDIYSFGVLALEMVTGVNHPLVAPSSLVPRLRRSWDEPLLRCFSSAAQRPKYASEVVASIERHRIPWKPTAVVVTALIALAAVFWQGSNSGAAARYGTEGATEITFDDGFTGDPSATADGKTLVYASDRGSPAGDLNIWSHRLDTGETHQLTSDPGDEDEPAISPNGKLLAYRLGSDTTLFLKALPNGRPRVIGKWIYSPRFSPDGTMLAYVAGHTSEPGQIWLLPLSEGRTPRRIAADFMDARFPAWSPDGRSILFRGAKSSVPTLEANREWWITDRDGHSYSATGAASALAKSGVVPHDTHVAWDGKHVVFSAANYDSTNLWRLNLFSILGHVVSSPQVITSGSGYQGIPAILGDGRVAYADWRHEGHIWQIDPGDGKMTKVTSLSSKDAAVSSSTDGKRIAFVRIRGKSRDIWIRDMESGAEHELWTGDSANPLLSPAGDKIAVSIGQRIWLLDIASGKREVFAENGGEIVAWSPDGGAIAAIENENEKKQKVVRLTLNDKSRIVLFEGGGFRQAAYSPNGKLLAVSVREDSAHSRIMVTSILPDGSAGEWKAATSLDHFSERPIWSMDDHTFYYVTDRDGFWCLFGQEVDPRTSSPSGEPKALLHLHSATNTLSHLVDASSGLARGGRSLFLCVGSERSNIWAVRP